MLDVASWIKRKGLAEVTVCQFQPGRKLRLGPEFAEIAAAGFLSDRLRDAFEAQGVSLSEGAYLTPVEPGRWRLRNPGTGSAFYVVQTEAGFEVLGPDIPPDIPWEAFLELGESCARRIRSFRPHVVGFRVEGPEIDAVRRRVEAVRLLVDSEIVLGGPTATSHPRETLLAAGADYVFTHEAEESFAKFLESASRDNSFQQTLDVPGLVYRYAGEVYRNEPPRDGYGRLLDAPHSIPRPAPPVPVLRENRLDWTLLENFQTQFEGLYFTGGRGCPGQCTFCAQLHGKTVRTKTAVQLIEEISAADLLVRRGALRVSRWPLFEFTGRQDRAGLMVSWASVYDEDFFLDRVRALEFLQLWHTADLNTRYRLAFQTNPHSLLTPRGEFDPELLEWIDRVSPMMQIGAESFHSEVLRRWNKRHTVRELETVLDALDSVKTDYSAFILWTDFQTTVEELLDSLWLLASAARRHPRMRIASSPYTIPLYESDVRRLLEFRSDRGRREPGSRRWKAACAWDYEQPQPGWMNPAVAELADLIDESLQQSLHLPTRDAALLDAVNRAHRWVLEGTAQPLHPTFFTHDKGA